MTPVGIEQSQIDVGGLPHRDVPGFGDSRQIDKPPVRGRDVYPVHRANVNSNEDSILLFVAEHPVQGETEYLGDEVEEGHWPTATSQAARFETKRITSDPFVGGAVVPLTVIRRTHSEAPHHALVRLEAKNVVSASIEVLRVRGTLVPVFVAGQYPLYEWNADNGALESCDLHREREASRRKPYSESPAYTVINRVLSVTERSSMSTRGSKLCRTLYPKSVVIAYPA